MDNADWSVGIPITSGTPTAGINFLGRAKKRAAIGNNVGSNDMPKGVVREASDGSLEYFSEKDNKWSMF